MTEDQIKATAEEYAKSTLNEYSTGVDKDAAKSLTSDLIQFLSFLSTRYCIVEMEKVKALHDNIHSNIMCAHDDDDWQDASHYILDVMPRRFAAVFGTSMFNQNKE